MVVNLQRVQLTVGGRVSCSERPDDRKSSAEFEIEYLTESVGLAKGTALRTAEKRPGIRQYGNHNARIFS